MVGDESSGSTLGAELETNVRTMKPESDKYEVAVGEKTEVMKTETISQEDAENKKLSKKKKPIESEDIRKDTFLKISEEVSHRKNGITEDYEPSVDNLIKDGSSALIAGNPKMSVSNFQKVFDKLQKSASTAFNDVNEYILVKYAFFISLIEINSYPDLLHARKLLQDLEKSLFADIPIYHYAVAKILIKFNRFRLAEDEIKKCRDSMKHHNFKSQCWPGTKEIIKETTLIGLEEYLNDLSAICSCYHLPDAVCKFGGCLSASTHPYPSREIFISDADFKGYVVLTCQEGCKIQYHPLCWKNVKDTFSNLDKLSDKDCLGKPCLTPDCKNTQNEPSLIHKIEIIGSDGNVKSQCVQDQVAENKQKEIALGKKRQRLKSDEHKTDKPPNKSKPRLKKISQPDRSQSSDNLATSMKSPTPKENRTLQICGITPVKSIITVKDKESRFMEMNNTAAQQEFICSYFMMLLNTMGPLTKEKVEEEWEKFYPICKPVSGLVCKSSGIFNLLKSSRYFVMIDDLLCIKESPDSTEKEVHEDVVNTNNTDTSGVVVESWSRENAQLDSEIREMEKELLANKNMNKNLNCTPSNSNMMPSPSLESVRKEIPVMGNNRPQNMNPFNQHIHSRPLSFGFFDEPNSEDRSYAPHREHGNYAEVGFNKSTEISMMPEFTSVPEEFRLVPPPVQWRDEGMPIEDVESAFRRLSVRNSVMREPPPHGIYESVKHKEMCTQTDATWENKGLSDDEMWVQHMQMAVNGLVKKNKDLMKTKEDMIRAHENEVEALMNQMKTLRNSYEEQIKSLKESHSRNYDDDRRRMIALEQRMKLQEQILQCTKEDLRKKDFDLLDTKRYLGSAILERIERESNRQVQRLVTALASLPCNNSDADAVGRAMAKWELAGEHASKAKTEFMKACTRHQAKLYDGFGIDSLQELVIPIVEEPAGPCPLDNLTMNLLQDRENSEHNFARSQTNAPPEIPPFKNLATSHPSPIPSPLSPAALGARPRESATATNGETSSALSSWPSTPSIHNSTHSSIVGTTRPLTNSRKLLIELKRCYPSRSEDELWCAAVSVRRIHKYSLSGLSIKRIVTMVGGTLEWWPEPSEGSMGLDKFMGWAADVMPPMDEAFHGVSKAPAWASNNSSAKRESEKDECCICLQGMTEPKTELGCLHSFHTQCIRKWLSKESVCPICRKFTRMPDEFPTLK